MSHAWVDHRRVRARNQGMAEARYRQLHLYAPFRSWRYGRYTRWTITPKDPVELIRTLTAQVDEVTRRMEAANARMESVILANERFLGSL